MSRNLLLSLIVILLTGAPGFASDPLKIYPSFWGQTANLHGLDPYILYSIALVESRRLYPDGKVRPWPWAITENGPKPKGHYPASFEEAKTLLHQLLRKTKNLDVGVLQVNLIHHGHRVKTPEQLLDLKTNIMVGAQILSEAMSSAPGTMERAVGRYHSWRPELSDPYGRKVLYLATSLREREVP